MVNINVLLFDPQKTNIRFIWDVSHGNRSHQPAKNSQGQQ